MSSQCLATDPLGPDPAAFDDVRLLDTTGILDTTGGSDHNQYYKPGKASLTNIAAVVTNQAEIIRRNGNKEYWGYGG